MAARKHAKRDRASNAATRQAPESKEKTRRFWPYGLVLFAAILFLDQWSKGYILRTHSLYESTPVFPGLNFTYIQNTGAAWGILPDMNGALLWLSVIAFGLLVFFYDKFRSIPEKVAYTLLLVGLWGNLLDRGVHGFVVDFIDFGWWPVFNVADSCIVIGVTIFIIEQLRKDFRIIKKPAVKTARRG